MAGINQVDPSSNNIGTGVSDIKKVQKPKSKRVRVTLSCIVCRKRKVKVSHRLNLRFVN